MNTMHHETRCDCGSPVREDLARIDIQQESLCVYGRAKNISKLKELKSLKFLWVSGVSTKTAEVISAMTWLEKLVIYGWRLSDCEPLSQLSSLHTLAIYQSNKLASLQGLVKLQQLRTLILEQDCGITDIEAVGKLNNLQTLHLSGDLDAPIKIETLAPLKNTCPICG